MRPSRLRGCPWLSLLLIGCAASDRPVTGGSTDESTATVDAGGTPANGDDPAGATLEQLRIVPEPARVVGRNGQPSTLSLSLEGTYSDGVVRAVKSAFWSLESERLAGIDRDSGLLTARGDLAGSVQVTAEASGVMATRAVEIALEHVVFAGGLPETVVDQWNGATKAHDPTRQVKLLYPLDGVVMPINVAPADVQWEGGVAGDVFRVHWSAPGVEVQVFVPHDGLGHWMLSAAAWRALSEALPESDVLVRVDRLEIASGEVVAGVERAVRFADATVRGSIYYWDLNDGRIQRLRCCYGAGPSLMQRNA